MNYYFSSALLQVYATTFGFLLVAIGFSRDNIKKYLDKNGKFVEKIINFSKWKMYFIWLILIISAGGFLLSIISIIQSKCTDIRSFLKYEIYYGGFFVILVAILFGIFVYHFMRFQTEDEKVIKMKKIKELEEEISILNKMLVSLVDLLEKRSILTHEEWEAEVRKKLKESEGLTKFRDLKE